MHGMLSYKWLNLRISKKREQIMKEGEGEVETERDRESKRERERENGKD